tara:strand:+ start:36 stop:419 length:384 start_codon:yes stop_codon:yes gene_type:complete
MKVIGLDGNEYNWKPASTHGKRSELHSKGVKVLESLFPHDNIIQEVPLAGTGKNPLRADVYLPNRNLIVEIHGEQHFKFVKFYHSTKANFMRAKARDVKKAEWCEINQIRLVAFNFDETEEEWRDKI